MATEVLPGTGAVPPGRWTDRDLWALPDDRNRYEIIDGELLVTPVPVTRHQLVAGEFLYALHRHAASKAELVLPAPVDVRFSPRRVVQPDVIYVAREHLHRITEERCEGGPDLVVEVWSPLTRVPERLAKRALYESEGVPEYWFADLDNDVIEVYRRHDGVGYAPPLVLGLDDDLTSGRGCAGGNVSAIWAGGRSILHSGPRAAAPAGT